MVRSDAVAEEQSMCIDVNIFLEYFKQIKCQSS